MTVPLTVRVAWPLPSEAVLVQPPAQRPRRDGAAESLRAVGGQQAHGPRGRPITEHARVTAENRRQLARADVAARRSAGALTIDEPTRIARGEIVRHPAMDRRTIDAELLGALRHRPA